MTTINCWQIIISKYILGTLNISCLTLLSHISVYMNPAVFPRYLEITLVHNVFKADIYCTPNSVGTSNSNSNNDNDTKNNATQCSDNNNNIHVRGGSHSANDARPVCVINHTFITWIAYNSSVYSTPTAILYLHTLLCSWAFASIVLLLIFLCTILYQTVLTIKILMDS